MDRLLVIPSVPQTEWMQDILPGTSPVELPIAGRRAIDYLVERVQTLGAPVIEILDFHPTKHFSDAFGERTSDEAIVFYHAGEGPMPQGLDDLPQVPGPLTRDISDGLMVGWGLGLPVIGPGEMTLEPISPEDRARTPPGLYRNVHGAWCRVCPQARLNLVQDIRSWHEANLMVLHHPDLFTIPGYSSEKGVNLGRNVVIEHGTSVKGPVLFCNNTWFARNVQFEGDVIVGRGSFIGEGAYLERTVVCENTYIGEQLVFRDKIVAGNIVVDALTGAWIDTSGHSWITRTIDNRGTGWMRSFVRFLFGASRGRRA